MGQGRDVHDRLGRRDQLGKAGVLDTAVGMQHLERRSGHALDAVQHDEAGPVGHQFAQGLALDVERQPSAAIASNARPIAHPLFGIAAGGGVRNGKAGIALLDDEPFDARRERSPIAVADDEADGSDGLDTAQPDVAEVAGLQQAAERARRQPCRLAGRLLGAEQLDRLRWPCFHGAALHFLAGAA